MFTSAWFPMCMSANMHGFGMHVGVRYQYWRGKGTQLGLGVCAFRKWWDPEAVISVLAWMTFFWGIHRRPGRALALHSSATLVGPLHASLAASATLRAVPVAGLLLTCAGYSFLPWGKRERRRAKL